MIVPSDLWFFFIKCNICTKVSSVLILNIIFTQPIYAGISMNNSCILSYNTHYVISKQL